MPILKALKRILSKKVEVEVTTKDVVIKVGEKKCNHHHCISRVDYHVTCIHTCGKKTHYREVTKCCECGQENYTSSWETTKDCSIVDSNWKKRTY